MTKITTVFGIHSEKVDNFTIFSNVSVDITIPSLLFEFSWSGVNQLGVERSSENFSLFTFTENFIESFKNILPTKMLDYQTFKLSLSLANQMEPASWEWKKRNEEDMILESLQIGITNPINYITPFEKWRSDWRNERRTNTKILAQQIQMSASVTQKILLTKWPPFSSLIHIAYLAMRPWSTILSFLLDVIVFNNLPFKCKEHCSLSWV